MYRRLDQTTNIMLSFYTILLAAGVAAAQVAVPETPAGETNGTPTRLGFSVNEPQPGVVRVEVVSAQQPQGANLARGDVIASVNGKPVASARQLQDLLAGVQTGTAVQVEILRGNERQKVELLAGEPAGDASPETETLYEFLGMTLAETGGGRVVVTALTADSSPAGAGIKVGDVIVRVDDYRVAKLDRLISYIERVLGGTAPGAKVLIHAYRGGNKLVFQVPFAASASRMTSGLAPARPGGRSAHIDEVATTIACMAVRDYVGGQVRVLKVERGTAAENAGFVPGDLIVAIGTTRVGSSIEMAKTLQEYQLGERVPVRIIRNGQPGTLELAIAPCGGAASPEAAVIVRQLQAQLAQMQQTLDAAAAGENSATLLQQLQQQLALTRQAVDALAAGADSRQARLPSPSSRGSAPLGLVPAAAEPQVTEETAPEQPIGALGDEGGQR